MASQCTITDPNLPFKVVLNYAIKIGLIKVKRFLFTSYKFNRKVLLKFISLYEEADAHEKFKIFDKVYHKMRKCYIEDNNISVWYHAKKSNFLSKDMMAAMIPEQQLRYAKENGKELREWIFDYCAGFTTPLEKFKSSYAEFIKNLPVDAADSPSDEEIFYPISEAVQFKMYVDTIDLARVPNGETSYSMEELKAICGVFGVCCPRAGRGSLEETILNLLHRFKQYKVAAGYCEED